MAFVPIQLPPGLERNNTPYDTPGRFWDMSLVRWQSGSMFPIKGWERLTSSPLDSAVRKIHIHRTNDNNRMVLVGTDNKLYVDQGGYTDITPTGFTPLSSIGVNGGYGTFNYGGYTYGTARAAPSPVYSPFAYWTMSTWGQDVILTANSDGRLFYYNVTTPTTKPTVISGAPTGNNAVIVTEERHVMVFGTDGNPRRVAWSSREDYTDWNYASTTNTAGFLDLSTKTALQKGVRVKEGILIFSLSDVYLASYQGLPYVYGFNRLSDTSLMHPDSVATFNGKAVWLSRNGFQLYAGGYVQPLDCPILNDILGSMDPTYGPFRMHASHNGAYPEVWFWWAEAGQTECNRYAIWNYAENWWGWGTLSRSAMVAAEVYKDPYMGAADGNMYEHEVGWLDAGNTRVGKVYVETGALGIGNGDNFMEVRQVVPAIGHNYNVLNITFYGKFTPEGAERTFGPYTPRSDGYTDTRVTAREARIRFQNAADGDWSVGKVRLDVAPGAGR